jgi:hypothetical protein
VDLALKVHDHDRLNLGHLGLERLGRQVALPVGERRVAKAFGFFGWLFFGGWFGSVEFWLLVDGK